MVFLFTLTACQEDKTSQSLTENKISIETQSGDKHFFTVELALTPEQQQKGLMYREEMAEDHGMLFFFNDGERERSFWMKNTYIPLDLLYIRQDGRVHHIHKNAKPLDLSGLPSKGPVAAVLEINAGLSDRLGLQKGDQVYHPLFSLN